VVTLAGQTTTTAFTYEGLSLLRLTATQTGGSNPTSWQITFLYDEYGKPYGGVYRSPVSATTATVFGLVTSDRGDVLALTDAAGASFAAYRYDAWGNPQGTGNLGTGVWSQTTGLIDATLGAAITSRQPLRYAGYCDDQESGLYYLSARTYDPFTRQFVSKDPAKADGEESAYQYCVGDPIGYSDASGRYYSSNKVYNFVNSTQLEKHDSWCWLACGVAVARSLLGWRRDISQESFWASVSGGLPEQDVGGSYLSIKNGLSAIKKVRNGKIGLNSYSAPGEQSLEWLRAKVALQIPVIVLRGSGGLLSQHGHWTVVWAVDPDNKRIKYWDPEDNTPRNEKTYSWLKQGDGWKWKYSVWATR